MGDAFVGLLPYLPGIPFSLALVVVYRLWLSAVRELRIERKDHDQTQGKLDAARDSRRVLEDKVDELTREVRGLRAEVGRLRTQLGEAA
ncbi:MAG: hypothetical protein ACM30G_02555 [Micromonosporaceae bacterium]